MIQYTIVQEASQSDRPTGPVRFNPDQNVQPVVITMFNNINYISLKGNI